MGSTHLARSRSRACSLFQARRRRWGGRGRGDQSLSVLSFFSRAYEKGGEGEGQIRKRQARHGERVAPTPLLLLLLLVVLVAFCSLGVLLHHLAEPRNFLKVRLERSHERHDVVSLLFWDVQLGEDRRERLGDDEKVLWVAQIDEADMGVNHIASLRKKKGSEREGERRRKKEKKARERVREEERKRRRERRKQKGKKEKNSEFFSLFSENPSRRERKRTIEKKKEKKRKTDLVLVGPSHGPDQEARDDGLVLRERLCLEEVPDFGVGEEPWCFFFVFVN